jgi:integrase
MGRGFKILPQQVAASIKSHTKDATQIKHHFIKKSIKDKTKQSYASHITWLKQILRHLGTTDLTEETFLKVLLSIEGKYEGHKAEQLRDAILYHRATTGEWNDQQWIQDPVTRVICEGFKYQNGEAPAPTRGASTPEQLEQFIKNLRGANMNHFIIMTKLHHAAGLRTQELILIRSGDYDSQTKELLIRVNKGHKATDNKKNTYKKPIISSTAHKILVELQRTTPLDQPLFSYERHSRTEYNKLFKTYFPGSPEHPDLVFVPHSLRHQFMVEKKTFLEKAHQTFTRAQQATMSTSMSRHYGRTNAARTLAINRRAT